MLKACKTASKPSVLSCVVAGYKSVHQSFIQTVLRMKTIRCLGFVLVVLTGLAPTLSQAAQLTDADYARAAKFLGRSTDPLVGHNYDPRV